MNDYATYILATAIVFAGLLVGGIYQTGGGAQYGGGLVINKFTGATWSCQSGVCTRIIVRPTGE